MKKRVGCSSWGLCLKGVGRELGRAIVHHFEKNGVEWICGEAFHSDRMRDMSYYQPWGFEIYDKKESSLFSSKMGKIYMISVTINLKDPKIRKIWGL
jgi:hypothetical protein